MKTYSVNWKPDCEDWVSKADSIAFTAKGYLRSTAEILGSRIGKAVIEVPDEEAEYLEEMLDAEDGVIEYS